jgi:3D (Asp-Asp-Asp) domain-containing protein
MTTVAPALAQGTSSSRYVVAGTGGDGLMVRDGPGTDASALGALTDGTEVLATDGPVSDGQRTWLRVQSRGPDGLVGWCSMAYLQPTASSARAVGAADPPGGTGATARVTAAPASAPASRTISALVTGYATGGGGGRIGATTASGTRTHWGTVAADLKRYPFGTKMTIEGFEGTVFVVEDTGGAMHGDIFDVWFPDLASAAGFGTQRRKVTILGPS